MSAHILAAAVCLLGTGVSPAQEDDADPNAATPPSGPGQFEVDEEAARRALERTLVQTGALLLPRGLFELTTDLRYLRDEQERPVLFDDGSTETVGINEFEQSIANLGLTFRFGLPARTQIELRLPYRYADQTVVTRTPNQIGEISANASGADDVSFGFARTLMRESGKRPDLIGRITWNGDNGETDTVGILPQRFTEYEASLTALKRQDPLVFTASASYSMPEDNEGVQPGDSFRLSVGVLLAASPQTSLFASLDQVYTDEVEVDDSKLEGTSQLISMLSLGASSVVGRRQFLQISVGAGLTDDSPKYSTSLAWSVRF